MKEISLIGVKVKVHMTENIQTSQETSQPAAAPVSDKELNFRRQQQMYEKRLEEERRAREELAARLAAIESSKVRGEDDEDDDEPYVDSKKLSKTLDKFGQRSKQEISNEVKTQIQMAIEQDRRERWLEQNPDFESVLSHAEKLAEMAPGLARSILSMPDSFERQKMVYENIKLLGIHKPKSPESSIQQKIDANRRSPYYQPSSVGAAPYQSSGDFSKSGMETAYAKMRELGKRFGG